MSSLWTWEWRPEVIFTLGALFLIYLVGWLRLRRLGATHLAGGWQLLSYTLGMFFLITALLSAIDALQSLLFSVHMIQHLLLIMVAAPLILLGNPFPIGLHAFPRAQRRAFVLVLGSDAPLRRLLRTLATPVVTFFFFVATFWLWHDPDAYNLALKNDFIHDTEHISFFITALLFWWHIIAAPPRIFPRLGYGWRLALLIAGLVQNEILSIAIAFASTPWYTYYTRVPRLWGLSPLQDQRLGGAIMWVPGGMMYLVAIVALLARFLGEEEQKQPLPLNVWANEETMIAPGMRNSHHV